MMSLVLPGRPVRSSATSAIAKTIALGAARRQSPEWEMAINSVGAHPREWMPAAFPRRVIAQRFWGHGWPEVACARINPRRSWPN